MDPPKQIQFIQAVDQIPNNLEAHDTIIIADTNCPDNWQFLVKVSLI